MLSFPIHGARWALLFLFLFLIEVTLQAPVVFLNESSAQGATAIGSSRYTVLAEEEIQKPENDTRGYRYIELQNGIKALLISHPETKKAAAALGLNVGSMMNPYHIPGLAHLVEHVVHSGTEKYPDAGEYMRYIANAQGRTNAVTLSAYSIFYFDIHKFYLHEALKRFSALFISPLFRLSNIDEEVDRIELEQKRYSQEIHRRVLEIYRTHCNPLHPLSKFSVGNAKMLRTIPEAQGINMQSAIREFFDQYYLANNMYVVVLGKESLNILGRWVNKLFSPIPQRDVPEPSALFRSSPWDGLPPEKINQIIRVEDSINTIHFIWTLPTPPEWNDFNPLGYLCYLFANNTNGSVFSLLESKGWITHMEVHIPTSDIYFNFVDIQLDLTPEGEASFEDVVVTVFQYVHFLKSSHDHERCFHDFRRIQEAKLRYQEYTSPLEMVTTVVFNLQSSAPTKFLLSEEIVPTVWNATRFLHCIDIMLSRFQLILLGSETFLNATLDQTEAVYGTPYAIEPISKKLIEKIKQAGENINTSIFSLPVKDAYVPFKKYAFDESMFRGHPEIFHASHRRRFWHVEYSTLSFPQIHVSVAFQSFMIGQSAMNRALTDVLVMYIQDALTDLEQGVEFAGLHCEVESTDDAIRLFIYGNSEDYAFILEEVVRVMTDLAAIKQNTSEFQRQLGNLQRVYTAWTTRPPYQLALFYVLQAIQRPKFTPIERNDVLATCTLDLFLSFIEALGKTFFIESLYMGKAINVVAFPIFQRALEPFAHTTPSPMKLEAIQWPQANLKLEIEGHDPKTSAVVYYFQVCNASDYKFLTLLSLYAKITENFVMTRFGCNSELNECVLVKAGLLEQINTIGYYISVQSELPVEFIELQIHQCLMDVLPFLDSLQPTEFLKFVKAYASAEEMMFQSLTDHQVHEMYWYLITKHDGDFYIGSQKLNYIYQHSPSDVRNFYLHYIYPTSPNCRRLIVRYANAKRAPMDSILIDDLHRWVSEQEKFNLSFSSSSKFS